MSIETTYTHARENLASLWDAAVEDHEVIIIRRRGSEPVAMMAASELSGLMARPSWRADSAVPPCST